MSEARKKPEQILQLDPTNELVFKGPFKDVVATTLTLTNPTSKVVAFKVKTTAPRHYCVKPNCGTVPPSKSVVVDVMLQPFDHSSSDNKKHKFMVQTIVIPDGLQDIESLWKSGEAGAMMDSKLKCVFQMPTESQLQEEDTASTSKAGDQGVLTTQTPAQSPSPAFTSPMGKTPSHNLPASSAFVSLQKSPGNENQRKESSTEAPSTTNKSQSSVVPQKQFEEQLESLRADNLRLKKIISDLKEEGPKLRTGKDHSQLSGTGVAGVNVSQELTAAKISAFLVAITALLLGLLIGKFIL